MDDYIETSHPSFDHLVVHTPNELYKIIFAVKDNRVIKVSYSGFASLQTLIEEIDNVL